MSAPNARPRPKQWAASLVKARERMANAADIVVEGTLNRMVGMTLEAVGCEAAVGGRCLIDAAEGKQIEAEVVGFSGDKLFLMPTGDIRGIMPGARVIPTRSVTAVAVGDEVLGRVLDGAGRPLDGFGLGERPPQEKENRNDGASHQQRNAPAPGVHLRRR